MIGYVRGIVTHLFKESCYVDVHGVGYRVYVPTTTRQQLIEAMRQRYLRISMCVKMRCNSMAFGRKRNMSYLFYSFLFPV